MTWRALTICLYLAEHRLTVKGAGPCCAKPAAAPDAPDAQTQACPDRDRAAAPLGAGCSLPQRVAAREATAAAAAVAATAAIDFASLVFDEDSARAESEKQLASSTLTHLERATMELGAGAARGGGGGGDRWIVLAESSNAR